MRVVLSMIVGAALAATLAVYTVGIFDVTNHSLQVMIGLSYGGVIGVAAIKIAQHK